MWPPLRAPAAAVRESLDITMIGNGLWLTREHARLVLGAEKDCLRRQNQKQKAPSPMRVFALSDLHVDFTENKKLLERYVVVISTLWLCFPAIYRCEALQNSLLGSQDHAKDVCLVGGDISHEVRVFAHALTPTRGVLKGLILCPNRSNELQRHSSTSSQNFDMYFMFRGKRSLLRSSNAGQPPA